MPVKNDTPKEEFDFSNKELDESSPLNLKNDTKMMTESYRLAMSNFSVDDAKKYLIKYHYGGQSSKKSKTLAKLNDITSALKKFQCLWDLTQTGELDDKTKELMLSPRCGVPDDNIKCKKIGGKYRKKRYIFSGNKWWKKNLKYNINNFSNDLGSISLLEKEIHRAFEVWGSVSPLTFQSVGTNVIHDIDIVFARGPHGDADNFDGKGGTLAHAFTPPPYDLQGRTVYGDAHFDDDETFSMNTYKDINLFQVAVHEFGHVLGLRHSENWKAVMAPFYRSYTPYFKLHEDDINGIQELYGNTETTNTKVESDHRDHCNDSSIDAITQTEDGTIYIFKGQFYFEISNHLDHATEPILINKGWKYLPYNIDAGIYSKGKTFLFKNSFIYIYSNRKFLAVLPIYEVIDDLPPNIDSIFHLPYSTYDRIYVTSGDLYYRVISGEDKKAYVDKGYPKSLDKWWSSEGIHLDRIDAAFDYPDGTKRVFFFRGSNYYAYHYETRMDNNNYPRNIGEWWFGCLRKEKNALNSTLSNNEINGFAIKLAKNNFTDIQRTSTLFVDLSSRSYKNAKYLSKVLLIISFAMYVM